MRAVESAGGRVLYDWEWADGRLTFNEGPNWPQWLVSGLGQEYFGNVVAVDFSNRQRDSSGVPIPLDDSLFYQIGRFRKLESLDLGEQNGYVSDLGIYHLHRLPRLRFLSLDASRIHGDGLAGLNAVEELNISAANNSHVKWISNLKHLKRLGIWGSSVSDVGLLHLGKFSTLESMSIVDCPIAGSGLLGLKPHGRLKSLTISSSRLETITPITTLHHLVFLSLDAPHLSSQGIQGIGELKSLKFLNLSYSCLDDRCLSEVSSLSRLRRLDLSSTRITDSGLPSLSQLSQLQLLSVKGTTITKAGLILLEELPRLRHIVADDALIPSKRDTYTHKHNLHYHPHQHSCVTFDEYDAVNLPALADKPGR